MCTAIKHGGFVGRNLDVYERYGEEVIITPRKYTLPLRKEENITEHYAIIGMGTVARGYPLYFDAVNECGLYIAGLNYIGNAKYHAPKDGSINLSPYELTLYLLSICASASEAKEILKNINLVDIPFSRDIPCAELHWIIADKESAFTVEPDKNGLNIYDNPIGVLTNNPPFPYQLFNLNNYATLSPTPPGNLFAPKIPLEIYSEGMGGLGLPGDLSSMSRFVRATFHKSHSQNKDGLYEIFHLLSSVEMPDGSVKVGESYERTEYTSAVSFSTPTYYYRHYDAAGISAVKLFSENLDLPSLIRYPVAKSAPLYIN